MRCAALLDVKSRIRWESATQRVAKGMQRGVGGREYAANRLQKQYGLRQPGEGSAT
ncbi:hypothetical protein B4098_2184 [Heyndrickxia coagulans]|uniref:Uncharacterized protein n=1 Tax=Heyndrickxia coagulans TaxID=1398 RepID=A0A150K2Z2_HEYCO|nr:hypothetical protein B4098_2184 [Heyndrickxia coagulans]